MKANATFIVLFILFFTVILCLLFKVNASFHTQKEMMGGGGGFSVTSGLNLYNHQSCWKDPDPDSDQIYCTTDSQVMF
jgi:hypothetical protein